MQVSLIFIEKCLNTGSAIAITWGRYVERGRGNDDNETIVSLLPPGFETSRVPWIDSDGNTVQDGTVGNTTLTCYTP